MSPHLVLFFTRGVSLRTWSMVGMLDREVALYRRLCSWGFRVSFVTYGDESDLVYAPGLDGIRILCNRDGLALEAYENTLLSLHKAALGHADVFKTNQTYGSEIALAAATKFRKPLVARCGYMWSWNAEREYGRSSVEASEARRVEEKVFSVADRVVITTQAMKLDIMNRIPSAASKVVIIPNYVDTDLFRPYGRRGDPRTLLFVGRIAKEKNLESLLEAIRPLEVKLILIGEGKLRPELQGRFDSMDGRVSWEGNVPNATLPDYFNGSGIFVLPSHYEGHPKVLVEAMACGMPVIGADSPGIRELIEHEKTGFLCGTDPRDIRIAIEHLTSQPELCEELGKNARKFVRERYSLHKILEMELALLQEVIETRGDGA